MEGSEDAVPPGAGERRVTVSSAEVSAPALPAEFRLRELVDVPQFDSLMQAFHRATGILFALAETDGTIVSSGGWQEACVRFHRACPGTLARCQESDRRIGAHLHDGPFAGYKCLNGLMDYAAPILLQGRHIGTVFTGQLLHEAPDEAFFRDQARTQGLDEEDYLSAIRRVPLIPRERVEPVMAYFSQIAESLAASGLERLLLRAAQAESEARFQKLRESEQRYRFLAENMVDVIWTLDPATGRFTYVSPSVERLRGYTAEEIMAQPMTAALTPESSDAVLRGSPSVLANLESRDAPPPIQTTRVDQPRRDGSIVPTEVVTKVITDAAGRVVEVLGVSRDISERLAAEKALRSQEQMWRTVFAISPDGIVVTSLEGAILQISEKGRTMLGYETEEEIAGRNLLEFISPSYREKATVLLGEMLKGHYTGPAEYHAVRKDGSTFFIEANAEVLRDADGIPSLIFMIARDITARKRAEEELRSLHAGLERRVGERTAALEEANRELEAFSYSVSHELRSPLRAIDGFAARIAKDHERLLDQEGQRLFLQVRWNAQRMGRLIDDLLAFSRAGRIDMTFTSVDMTAAAQAAFDLVVADPAPLVPVSFSLGDLPGARGDEALLRRVWENLLSNAVKFSAGRERPEVRVEGSVEDGETVYRVSDNGDGFDMKYVDKLFGVFHRLHGPREFEGTGIGLALVRRIVIRHGGRAWAEGTPGRGATFSFSLPAGR
jgi:PAS domain S-box-containing protein